MPKPTVYKVPKIVIPERKHNDKTIICFRGGKPVTPDEGHKIDKFYESVKRLRKD